uniref:DUF393 domain-containing protein n=1 Tax=Amphora coffeiformis TaxID=265554 RepID=A0A7S3P764_9STRA|mmetsp:Transcript_15779/g.30066  ORF Transcript_15779/g.30066 Transcript_15779/m.30066 type:complete len:217 (+) Transcript_15779:110-760(+)|eukprot:scaffold41537_cov206-Amphora_coffeaeformis.AAC.3
MMITIQRKQAAPMMGRSTVAIFCLIFLLASPRESYGFSASPALPRPISWTPTSNTNHENKVVVDRVFATDQRPVMLFDGECNLCNSAVNQMIDWDPQGKLRFAALQSHVGQALLQAHGRRADDVSSIVVVTPDKGALLKSDAVLRLAQELNHPSSSWMIRPAKLGLSVMPPMLRDMLFDVVYGNRYKLMGKSDECRLDFDGEFDDRFVDDALADNQ